MFGDGPGWRDRLTGIAIDAPGGPSGMDPWVRAGFYALLVVYGVRLAAMDIPLREMASSLIHGPMVLLELRAAIREDA